MKFWRAILTCRYWFMLFRSSVLLYTMEISWPSPSLLSWEQSTTLSFLQFQKDLSPKRPSQLFIPFKVLFSYILKSFSLVWTFTLLIKQLPFWEREHSHWNIVCLESDSTSTSQFLSKSSRKECIKPVRVLT